jgi:ADP-heptose:LPS heptosyltransferase
VKYSNILAIRLSSLGDIIRAVPSLVALKSVSERLTFLTEDRFRTVTEIYPVADEVLLFPRKELSFSNLTNFLRELTKREYEIVLDLHGIFKSSLLTFLSKGQRKIGFDKNHSKEFAHLFYNEKVSSKGELTISRFERYEMALKHIGLEVEKNKFFKPTIGDEAEKFAKKFLQENNLEENNFALIFPGTSKKQKFKRCPLNNFIELAKKIENDLCLTPLFCLGPEESEYKESIKDNFILLESPNLLETSAIILKSKIFIGCDTGLMHLSAISGIKTIAIMGATNPLINEPWGERSRVVFKEGISKECKGEMCNHNDCMGKIKVDEVFKKVENLLNAI